MIDDLNRMDIGEASSAFADTLRCECPCGCECFCTECNCYCSSGDYAYDQDNTYLHYPSDTQAANGNHYLLGWEGIDFAVY